MAGDSLDSLHICHRSPRRWGGDALLVRPCCLPQFCPADTSRSNPTSQLSSAKFQVVTELQSLRARLFVGHVDFFKAFHGVGRTAQRCVKIFTFILSHASRAVNILFGVVRCVAVRFCYFQSATMRCSALFHTRGTVPYFFFFQRSHGCGAGIRAIIV